MRVYAGSPEKGARLEARAEDLCLQFAETIVARSENVRAEFALWRSKEALAQGDYAAHCRLWAEAIHIAQEG